MKKILAVLITVCLFVSMGSAALAADTYTDWTSTSSLPIASGKYKLTTDVTVTKNYTIQNNNNVVLDLNGHTITVNSYTGGYTVQTKGSLTIEDSSADNSGAIKNVTSNSSQAILVHGTCTINGGTIETTNGGSAILVQTSGTCIVNDPAKILNSKTNAGRAVKNSGTFTLNGGTVESKASNPNFNAYDIPAIESSGSSSTLNINGGVVKAANIAIQSSSGVVNVTSGEIEAGSWAFNTRNAVIEPAENSDVKVTAEKAIFKAQASGNHANEVLGGSFKAPQVSKDDKVIVEISGGIYTIKVADNYIAVGYECVDNDDATYKYIVKPVALTVSFEANGGAGEMEDDEASYGDGYTLPENGFTAPEGKQFKAWEVNGEEYAVGDEIEVVENTIITAIWEDIPVEPEPSDDPAPTPAPVVTPAPTAAPSAPKTGDNTNLALWMALMAISCVALVTIGKKSKASK